MHWDGWEASEYTKNVVYVDAGAAVATQGAVGGAACAEFLTPAPPGCTDVYADTFNQATFGSNIWWNTSSGIGPVNFPGGNCSTVHAFNGCAIKTFAEWQAGGQDTGSLATDPLFKCIECGDYTVTSPAAEKLGIVPLDLSRVGPDWRPEGTKWR